MRTIKPRKTGRAQMDKGLRKPNVLTLLGRILQSAFSGDVLWITAPGGALLTYLYVNRVASLNLIVLLLGAVVVLAFLRGCKAWQKDLDSYHKALSNLRNWHAS